MKASERKITKLFSESDTVFSIPVYQRDYNWQEKQCQRLFKDILQTGKNDKVTSYFLGSIVYIHDGIYGTGRLLSNEKFEILKGTSIVLEVKSDNATTFKRNKNLINDLLRKNLIEKFENKYIFKENYIATSPSAADVLILGYTANGWNVWKTYERKLLSEYKRWK